MIFYQKFAELCSNRGVSPSKAAIQAGINKSNVAAWKREGYIPRANTLGKIAKYFNVSTDYLLKDVEIENVFNRIGHIIREEREKQGLEQKQLAKWLGISVKRLQNYEQDKQSIPKNLLLEIAKCFGYTIPSLLSKYNINIDISEQSNNVVPVENKEKAVRSQIGFDDFTYAMYNESQELTEADKQKLLEMARFFKAQQDKEKDKK